MDGIKNRNSSTTKVDCSAVETTRIPTPSIACVVMVIARALYV